MSHGCAAAWCCAIASRSGCPGSTSSRPARGTVTALLPTGRHEVRPRRLGTDGAYGRRPDRCSALTPAETPTGLHSELRPTRGEDRDLDVEDGDPPTICRSVDLQPLF